jgi:hypothetical protein
MCEKEKVSPFCSFSFRPVRGVVHLPPAQKSI